MDDVALTLNFWQTASYFLAGATFLFLIGFITTFILYFRKSIELKGLQDIRQSEKEALDQQLSHFQSVATKALNDNHETFLKIAQERFQNWQTQSGTDLEKRQTAIQEMVKPVDENLKAIKSLMDQMKGTDSALREDLRELHNQTAKIAGAMRNPKLLGQWGEFILETLLQKAGLQKGIHFETQASVKTVDGTIQRPDVVIHLQDGLNIIVDSKAPVQDVLQDLDDPENAKHARAALATQIRSHIKQLGSKGYWSNDDTSPDFVVLFLPGDNLFSLALSEDPKLIDLAAEKNIILASPMLMLALARIVHMSWRQSELGKNAKEIADIGAELHKRMSVFVNHFSKLGKNLQTAVKSYSDTVGSFDSKVMPQIRKLEEKQATHLNDLIEEPEQLESSVRQSKHAIGDE